MAGIKVSVFHGEAFNVQADALILKYGKTSYGLEKIVEREFYRLGTSITDKLPTQVGQYFLTESQKITQTDSILFIGIEPMEDFGYKEIREYGKNAIAALAKANLPIKRILMTIQGPRLGLDENEAFSCQIAGIHDSIIANNFPPTLSEIIFVERSASTASILQNVIQRLFPTGEIPTNQTTGSLELSKDTSDTLKSVGIKSESKKVIFVAMPFASVFDDCFHYGIQGAVNSFGYLCERADLNSFTGDVMEFVKERIANSDFVIADLTTANPNVYLEVGYAWGLNKKTVLLIKDANELEFDTRGQRCLQYTTIKDLENKLKNELASLKL
ncbi:MAG: nucleoside 2-deoxyribosyltransferase [Bacteroidota bacterium]|nr:nucleoside 2-deoxyribosyltransferase [Bacteroidota bacterium]